MRSSVLRLLRYALLSSGLATVASAETSGQVTSPVTSAPQSSFTPPPAPPPLPPAAPASPSPRAQINTDRADAAIDRGVAGAPSYGPPASATDRSKQVQRIPRGPFPDPIARPLTITGADDPILTLGRDAGPSSMFRDAIVAAVERNPALDEAQATEIEARALRREAKSGLYPTADINVTSYRTISRDFATALNNIIERSRPTARTDGQLAINQPLFDFGATQNRITAANARLRAAAAGVDDAATQIALRTIGAWYDVFTYRSLVLLTQSYRDTQAARRADLDRRIVEGVSAPADVSQLQTSIASIDTRVARYRRQLASAEAQFTQLTGRPAPATLPRAPYLGDAPASAEEAREMVGDVPAVRASTEQAQAAQRDAKAVNRGLLPSFSAGIDAGRYGVFETARDYDVRGRITLRQQLGGALFARADQARARAGGAVAKAARIREEAARDAAIAFADVEALGQQTAALEQSYIAARQSRDTTEARFASSRGSLFDVVNANDTYFSSAAAYVESIADRDSAHYALLARTGRLLDALGISTNYGKTAR